MYDEDELILEEKEHRRYEERRKRRRRRRRREQLIRWSVLLLCLAALLFAVWGIFCAVKKLINREKEPVMAYEVKYVAEKPDFLVELLDINEYSRPGTSLSAVKGIVVHYTANPGTTAEQNRSYFQNLKDTGETYASSHFVIGMEGEVVQCIPCNEIAYASNERNADTIAIECCIPDDTGKFNEETYQALLHLTAWLVGRYDLSTDDVIRHYDVTGKECPKYYVENEEAWEQFKADLLAYIDTYGIAKTEEIK